MKWWRIIAIGVLVAAWPLQLVAVSDAPSYSTNYSASELNFGNADDGLSGSANYQTGGSTLGDSATGNTGSTNYQTNAGHNTADDPSLTFTVNTSSVNLGTLTSSAKATGTATFSVKDYTSYGYAVTVAGTAPTNSGHALSSLATDTASSAGTEQFGLNTVLNTVAGVGADPVQVPSGSFSFGVAGDGTTGTYGSTRPYTISDKWRFVPGETIASSPKTSGETDYTITFLANISALTPGGKYDGNIILCATGTY